MSLSPPDQSDHSPRAASVPPPHHSPAHMAPALDALSSIHSKLYLLVVTVCHLYHHLTWTGQAMYRPVKCQAATDRNNNYSLSLL